MNGYLGPTCKSTMVSWNAQSTHAVCYTAENFISGKEMHIGAPGGKGLGL